jgi:DNA-directed RNA polymerase specialized sigma24 family protein
MKFNKHTKWDTCWGRLERTCRPEEIEKALRTLEPDTAKVLRLYYQEKYSFKEITGMINRSIQVVQNHHAWGMHRLNEYFQNEKMNEVKKA